MKGERSKRQPLNSLRWPIYVINSTDNTILHLSLRYVNTEVRATGHNNCLQKNNKVGALKCIYIVHFWPLINLEIWKVIDTELTACDTLYSGVFNFTFHFYLTP